MSCLKKFFKIKKALPFTWLGVMSSVYFFPWFFHYPFFPCPIAQMALVKGPVRWTVGLDRAVMSKRCACQCRPQKNLIAGRLTRSRQRMSVRSDSQSRYLSVWETGVWQISGGFLFHDYWAGTIATYWPLLRYGGLFFSKNSA